MGRGVAGVRATTTRIPGNILFDGARLWLIDWETAYRNDPLADIAIMTMYVANTPELQETLIRSWLGRPSDQVLRARLVLMRMLVRLFYATANAFYVATARPDLRETDMAAPTPAEFRAALDEGRLISNTFEDAARRRQGRVPLLHRRARIARVRRGDGDYTPIVVRSWNQCWAWT